MARLPRLTVPGYPHHIIQRGNNRQTTFHDDEDRRTLLGLLDESARKNKVALHSYVLMSNHLHLLATPETQTGVPTMMQAVGRRYVQYFNKRHQRSGTLWEGRYRSTLVQPERYLLACMVYVDLNPVRARMALKAEDYPWSSYGHYAGLRQDPILTPHALYWQLGNTPFAREANYSELVAQGQPRDQQKALTESALKGWALGEPDFVAVLQQHTKRRAIRSHAGRPVGGLKSSSTDS